MDSLPAPAVWPTAPPAMIAHVRPWHLWPDFPRLQLLTPQSDREQR